MPRRRRSTPGVDLDLDLGVLAPQRLDERQERCPHRVRVGLAGHDTPVDVDLTPVRHDVGGAAPFDDGGVHRRATHERVFDVGEHFGQPQQEPGHRRDRVHASVRLRAMGCLPEGCRREPCAPSLGEPDLQLTRFTHDRASWVSRPRSQSTFVPCTPASSSSAARWKTSDPASGVPARRSADAAARAAPIGPFMSRGAAADEATVVVDVSGPRIVPPCVEGTGRHDVEVAVPREAGPLPVPSDATTLGRPAPNERSRASLPLLRGCRSRRPPPRSSVPPGFSLFAAISARV